MIGLCGFQLSFQPYNLYSCHSSTSVKDSVSNHFIILFLTILPLSVCVIMINWLDPDLVNTFENHFITLVLYVTHLTVNCHCFGDVPVL